MVIPASLRPDMLQVIHEEHLRREKCKARTRVSLYWYLMGVDIEEVGAGVQCVRNTKLPTRRGHSYAIVFQHRGGSRLLWTS